MPDIVLMDIGMPGNNGMEDAKLIREHYPEIKILMQTILKRMKKYFKSCRASGYILKFHRRPASSKQLKKYMKVVPP